jgi:hypothetical protein
MGPVAAHPGGGGGGGHQAAVGNGCGEGKHSRGIELWLGVRATEGAFVLAVVVGVRVGVRVNAGVPQS